VRISQEKLPFKIQSDHRPEGLTSHAGIPLLIEWARGLGLTRSLEESLPASSHPKAYHPVDLCETFVAALAAGATSLEDVAFLGTDRGLRSLLRRKRWPSADTLGRFLGMAHELPSWQAGARGAPCTPPESVRLCALDRANQDLVAEIHRRQSITRATIDLDATIIESSRREALPHYDNGRGYQPWVAFWSEAGLIVADEFREGNVSAQSGALDQVKKAFARLPVGP